MNKNSVQPQQRFMDGNVILNEKENMIHLEGDHAILFQWLVDSLGVVDESMFFCEWIMLMSDRDFGQGLNLENVKKLLSRTQAPLVVKEQGNNFEIILDSFRPEPTLEMMKALAFLRLYPVCDDGTQENKKPVKMLGGDSRALGNSSITETASTVANARA